jgi:hypothetical protein
MTRPSEWFRAPKTPWTWPMIVLGALVAIVFVGVILSLTFAGCAAQPGGLGTSDGGGSVRQGDSADITEHTVTLSDGRTVTCLTWSKWDFVNEVVSSGMDCLEPEAQ